MDINSTTPPLSPVILPNPIHPNENRPNSPINGAMTVVHNSSESMSKAAPSAKGMQELDAKNIEKTISGLKLNSAAKNSTITLDLSNVTKFSGQAIVVILPYPSCCTGEIGVPGLSGGTGEISIPGVPGGTGEIGIAGVLAVADEIDDQTVHLSPPHGAEPATTTLVA